ncbi:hypothetical protein EV360DRAFT_86477 [Lentinula raphanica]|nr:hypothetical protein EV360DRAFT_86477 [Lentinula raphanica]
MTCFNEKEHAVEASPKDLAPSESPEQDPSPSSDEEVISWEDFYNDDYPNKKQSRLTRNLRFQIFNVYRRLFCAVFIANMAIFVAFCVRGASVPKLGEVAIANLFVATLCRQEYVINAIFFVLCSAPKPLPLWIRLKLCRVYSLPGGIHSGSAISGTIWLVLFVGQATRSFVEGGEVSAATLGVTYSILLLLLVIILFSYPSFRSKQHDAFEYVHRFMGWTVVVLVWAQSYHYVMPKVVLLNNDYKGVRSLVHALRTNATFWLVAILTASIALQWTRLRKETVKSEVLSNHALRLYFDYADEPVPGSFIRISNKPLLDWHSFATISEPGKKGFSIVISRAGDWTSAMIASPPPQVWVKGIPVTGVMRIVPLFRRVVVVATGSGIGPCVQHPHLPLRHLLAFNLLRSAHGSQPGLF